MRNIIHLPVHSVNMVVLQTDQVDAFSLHSPMMKHGFQVLHTKLLNHPSVDNLVSIGGGPQHAAPKQTNKQEKKN